MSIFGFTLIQSNKYKQKPFAHAGDNVKVVIRFENDSDEYIEYVIPNAKNPNIDVDYDVETVGSWQYGSVSHNFVTGYHVSFTMDADPDENGNYMTYVQHLDRYNQV